MPSPMGVRHFATMAAMAWASASIPVTIFQYSEAPDRALNAQAWAAAFLLIAFVLLASLVSRILLERSRRRLGRAG